MSDPIVEQINQWLVSALAEISTANGYQQDLKVRRIGDLREADESIADLTTIVGLDDPERLGPRTRAGVRWAQVFGIATYIIGRGGTALSEDRRINIVRSDIEKRLGVEIANEAGPGSICGGLADRIEIREPKIAPDKDEQTSILYCFIAISYRTSATDPYSQA